jgi:hypothetical protein
VPSASLPNDYVIEADDNSYLYFTRRLALTDDTMGQQKVNKAAPSDLGRARGRASHSVDDRSAARFKALATTATDGQASPVRTMGRSAHSPMATGEVKSDLHPEPERLLGTNRPSRRGGHRRCARPEPGNRDGGPCAKHGDRELRPGRQGLVGDDRQAAAETIEAAF